jgi:succinoglycan biosynthesis transport protein ExoP
MEPYTKTFSDYLDLVKRRKVYIGVTWLVLTLTALIVAFNLPKIYRSTATLLIEAPVPAKVIDSSISQYGEEQIESIYQRALSTRNILAIIESSGIYDDIKDSFTRHELAEFFRESTDVELRTSAIAPKTQSQMAEIAFDVSFNHNDPVKAQEIASKLAALFIEQNDKARTLRATKATDFLTEEADKLNRELQEIDGKIAKYKEEHPFSLPEQVEGNQAAIDRAESELRDTESHIRATKERIAFLSAELAIAQKDPSLSLDDKTPRNKEALLAQYLRLSSIYSANHPSLVRLKREIKALDPSFDGQSSRESVQKQLLAAKRELEFLQETYAGAHPDIGRRKNQIRKLEQQLKTMPAPLQGESNMHSFRSSPAYLNIEAQYKSSQSELESLTQKREYLKTKIENLHDILLRAPQIEMVYTDMIRERDNIIKKYNQLKEKRLDAKLAQTLEEQQQGQTLTLIEQPAVPRNPEKAIRTKVMFGGLFMGLIGGLGMAFLVEFMEPGLWGGRAIESITGLMPLVVVPYIDSPGELEEKRFKQRRMRTMVVWAACAFLSLAAVLIGIGFLGLRQA